MKHKCQKQAKFLLESVWEENEKSDFNFTEELEGKVVVGGGEIDGKPVWCVCVYWPCGSCGLIGLWELETRARSDERQAPLGGEK